MTSRDRFSRLLSFVMPTLIVTVSFAGNARAQTLVTHSAVDSQVIHRQQETYLMPQGWNAADTYIWHAVREGLPVVLSQNHKIKSPDGSTFISWEGGVAAQWMSIKSPQFNNSHGIPDSDTGSEMYVKLFEISHPGADVHVLSHSDKPCPSINDALVANTHVVPGGLQPSAAAYQYTVVLSCTLNGIATLCLSSGTYDRLRFVGTDDGTLGSRGMDSRSGTWQFRQDYNIVAPASQFKAVSLLAQKILPSVKIDPSWKKAYDHIVNQQIAQVSAQIQGNINASRISMQYANALALRDWNRQQGINNALGDQQDRFLRNAPLEIKYLTPNVTVTIDHSQSQDQ